MHIRCFVRDKDPLMITEHISAGERTGPPVPPLRAAAPTFSRHDVGARRCDEQTHGRRRIVLPAAAE